MSTLEFNGGLNNRRIVTTGNITASNDPAQLKHDLNEQLIKGAEVLAAGDLLGMPKDEAIKKYREKQKEEYLQKKMGREAYLKYKGKDFAVNVEDDELVRDSRNYERGFQKEMPQREADVFSDAEYGSNEADLQQVSSDRVESIQQQDQSGLGRTDRVDKKFRGARRDNLPYKVNVNLDDSFELDGTPRGFVQGEVQPGQIVPRGLREAAILQDAELTDQKRSLPMYQSYRKGPSRRNFGTVLKDANDDVVKERLSRVKRARPAGQTLNPEDVISVDKFETARRARERGIGNDGPEEMRRVRNTPSRAQIGPGSAYDRLVKGIENGTVEPTEENFRLLDRMLESADPQTAARNTRIRGRDLVKASRPVGAEASERQARSRKQAEKYIVSQLIASQGSTPEMIGETVMSDEVWKAKAQKVIPSLPIRSQADNISDRPVYQMVNQSGQVVGHSDGTSFLGEVNDPTNSQMLNAPTPADKSLMSFIGENLDPDSRGGDFQVNITDATNAFTDRARGLTVGRFGRELKALPPGIRSFTDASELMARIIQEGQNQDLSFSRFDPEEPTKPKKIPPGQQPTVGNLMSTMDIDKKEQKNLANALYMMALAEGQAVNQEGKQRFAERRGSYQPVYRPNAQRGSVNLDLRRQGIAAVDLPNQNITFDSPAGRFYDGAELAYVPNSKRKKIDGENIYLQATLRNLEGDLDEETRAPFIGATKERGEAPEVFRKGFNREGYAEGISMEEGYKQMERDRIKNSRKRYDQRKVDFDIARARGVEQRTERMYEDQMIRQIMQEVDSRKADERFKQEVNLDFDQQRMQDRKVKLGLSGGNPLNTEIQSIKPAPVQRSIAPDPWAQPGPNSEPMVSAGGGMGGQPPRRPVAALPYGFSDGSQQGPDLERKRGPGYKTTLGPGNAQGRVERRLRQMENLRTNPKYQRGRRIAYGVGGATALGSILGIGNDDEREARYQ